MRMPQRQARGRVGQAAVMRSVLELCNPTRRVGYGSELSGSGRVGLKLFSVRSGRVEFSTKLLFLIGMAFELRMRKSERLQR